MEEGHRSLMGLVVASSTPTCVPGPNRRDNPTLFTPTKEKGRTRPAETKVRIRSRYPSFHPK